MTPFDKLSSFSLYSLVIRAPLQGSLLQSLPLPCPWALNIFKDTAP